MGEITGFGSAQKSIMHILDDTGDTKIMWNPRDTDEVKNAKRSFSELKGKGFRAFKVKRDGDKGAPIEEFDKDAEKIIFIPQMAGGAA